jgi:lipopolysaccharide transport system ATP-binding protein
MGKVIKVENVSKMYRLGVVGSSTIGNDLSRFWARMRGKEDPFLKIAEANDRSQKGLSDFVYALQDINFEVEEGEVLGLIGKNGAGKSTLLKVLSRVTMPTTGVIKAKGRTASLLEVGTGFHPELTGRENIFLNGAILGMREYEVRSKLDEIIAFSGVERFIDTPVKRYSSGMYVRLAFAVAAHLEPEILIIDEVLAVGDSEFQKKCLGKMGDISKTGRTVLFVSHNMKAVKSLCKNALLLEYGQIVDRGTSESVVNNYLSKVADNVSSVNWMNVDEAPGTEIAKLRSVELTCNTKDVALIDVSTEFQVDISFYNLGPKDPLNLVLRLYNITGECIFNVVSDCRDMNNGIVRGTCFIPKDFLNAGVYTISVMIVRDMSKQLFLMDEILQFEVHDDRDDDKWFGEWIGAVRPKLRFEIEQG